MSVLNELMNYTFVSKYARWLPNEHRRETWKEAVNRVKDMMHTKYADKNITEDIDFAYDMMMRKKVLGSQRALQYGGEPALKKSARVYNCVSSYCDRVRFFQECFWLLLCGCGTGFSVQKHHINKLPNFVQANVQAEEKTYTIPDTIEGWADALGVLLTNYFGVQPGMEAFAEYAPDVCSSVVFDYSKIRPKGSPLSSGVGNAPGPDGLRAALVRINKLLTRCRNNHPKLRPIDAYDIVMHASDAVLSGGVRRSATIALFSPDDIEMMRAKTGNWLEENPQRARSNNSAVLIRGKTSYEQFKALVEHTKEYGEPGFFWVDDPEALGNPCVEIQFWCYKIVDQDKYNAYMEKYDGNGYKPVASEIGLVSGWQGCNLSTINASAVKNLNDFLECAKAAAIIGTLQAGYTKFDYLGEVSEDIFKREALLGVSMTGTMESFDVVLDAENQKKVAAYIKQVNADMAAKIGINQAARTTCLKPEGTASCLLGTSSGIHPHHAKRYIRHVQVNKTEAPYQHFSKYNPSACVPSKWSANNTDDIIMFPIEVPDGAKTKNQISAIELLKIVKSTQQNWVREGKNEHLCTQPWLCHNVSNTVTVLPEEWDEVTKFIYNNRDYFTGISLLPQSGDKDYAQAPFTSVSTAKEIVREYGDAAIWTSGLIERALEAFDNDLWKACDFLLLDDEERTYKLRDSLEVELPKDEAIDLLRKTADKMTFIRKASKFVDKYFEGDTRRLTYCLKDVYNWKLYCDLVNTFNKVDYTTLIETEDNTAPEQEGACAGGTCEVNFGPLLARV